jgi:hypothetical protein
MSNQIDYDKMQRAFEAALRSRGFSGGSSSGFSSGPSQGASSAGPDTEKFIRGLGTATSNLRDFGTSVYESGKEYLGVFRNLSNAGTNFSNDIVKIGVAAADSRLSLAEFSDVIRENGKNFAGLGGSVTRGAEAFSKLSKEFFDSRLTDELKQLGYTSKELNDVLAIQMSTQRSTFNDSETGRKAALASAASLAIEMDRLAKLTGKTREEQMKEAQKRATDGQIEAKLRLIGIEQGAEAEAKARAAFQEQMAQAEARGMGQMAKELFATGTIISDEAAAQYALLGDAAQKTGEQMQHLAKGNIAAAEAASKEADAANARNQRDPNLLRIATFGEAAGIAGTVLKQNVEVNMALHDAVMAAAKGLKPGLTNSIEDFRKALEIVNEDIRRSREGRTREGEQVSGVTRAAVRGGIQLEELRAGVARGADAAVGGAARQIGISAEEYMSENLPTAADTEDRVNRGLNPRESNLYASPSERREDQGGIVGTIARALSNVSNMGVKLLEVENANLNVPGRRTGSIGEVGKLIEDFGQGTLAMLHGREGVVTESQMMDLAKGFKAEGVSSAINQLRSSITVDDTQTDDALASGNFSDLIKTSFSGMPDFKGAGAGIDLSSISNEIETSISSVKIDQTNMLSSFIEQQNQALAQVLESTETSDVTSLFQSFKEEIANNLAPVVSELQQAMSSNQNITEQQDDEEPIAESQSSIFIQNDASLKDVVNSLDRLNMLMGQLLVQQEDIGMKQIRASRSAGSPDLYDNL